MLYTPEDVLPERKWSKHVRGTLPAQNHTRNHYSDVQYSTRKGTQPTDNPRPRVDDVSRQQRQRSTAVSGVILRETPTALPKLSLRTLTTGENKQCSGHRHTIQARKHGRTVAAKRWRGGKNLWDLWFPMSQPGKYGKGDFREGGNRGGHACALQFIDMSWCGGAPGLFPLSHAVVLIPCHGVRWCAQCSNGTTSKRTSTVRII
jgi:hypothetical protein